MNLSTQDQNTETSAILERENYIFMRSLPLQLKVHELRKAIGSVEGGACLDTGASNCMVSYHLRRKGEDWHTVVPGREKAECFKEALEENVHEMEDGHLPFTEKMFDVVVIDDYLEKIENPHEFVAECHKVLNPDGRLIIHARHAKRAGLTRLVDKVLGLSPERRGLQRIGFTEPELFGILKTGFDVHQVRSYSRFFVSLLESIVAFGELRARKKKGGDGPGFPVRLYKTAGICYKVAYQLDFLLFLTRGHYLIATAKRRGWRTREAPILSDGRSIAEAVVSKTLR